MKASRFLVPARWLALGLALIGPAALAAPASQAPVRGEHRLTGAEIRDLAKREVLWCDAHHPDADDCEAITLIRLAPDGRLAESTTLLVSDGPRLQAFIGEFDDIKGDQVCSKVAVADMPMSFVLEGKAVSGDAATGLRAVLVSSLADLDGKLVCQSFYAGSDPMQLREEVTVEGKRRKDLETTYLLRESATDGFGLRAQVGKDEQKGQTI
jgi:hypothetical protein